MNPTQQLPIFEVANSKIRDLKLCIFYDLVDSTVLRYKIYNYHDRKFANLHEWHVLNCEEAILRCPDHFQSWYVKETNKIIDKLKLLSNDNIPGDVWTNWDGAFEEMYGFLKYTEYPGIKTYVYNLIDSDVIRRIHYSLDAVLYELDVEDITLGRCKQLIGEELLKKNYSY